MSVKWPVRVGVITMLVSIPGTRSCFCPIAGIQNEWITSADCSSKVMLRLTGITSSYDLRPLLSGYSKRQANCCANTLIVIGFVPASPFWESTTALTTPIAITRIAGTTVQTISSPVCPWIDGPSDSSSGAARNVITE